MAMLGKRQEDDGEDEKGGDAVTLPLNDFVCPTCGRDLAPWVSACPEDGATPVDRTQTMLQGVPDIPVHLLAGLDDDVDAPQQADTAVDPPATGPDVDGEEGDAG